MDLNKANAAEEQALRGRAHGRRLENIVGYKIPHLGPCRPLWLVLLRFFVYLMSFKIPPPLYTKCPLVLLQFVQMCGFVPISSLWVSFVLSNSEDMQFLNGQFAAITLRHLFLCHRLHAFTQEYPLVILSPLYEI